MADDTNVTNLPVPAAASAPAPDPAPVDTSAKGRLRAFEDKILGPDAPRMHGKVERGHGSLYQRNTTPEQKAQHVALEHLVEAEDHMAKASAALEKAKADHAKAEDDLAKHEKAADAGK